MTTTASDPSDRDPTHLGAVAVLGAPLPRNRQRWFFLAAKSAAATLAALAADRLTGNPDHVTSTFVAVLCVSPVVLMGLRRSLDQVAGSLIGGTLGTLAALALPGPFLGIPLAVGGAVLTSFALGFGRGYTVAAFTALFVQAVPRGTPLETLEVRLLAVATGAAAAFLVNVLVSSTAYRGIFRRRLRFAEATVSALLIRAAEQGPRVVQAGFPVLAELEHELAQARGELGWRRTGAGREWIEELRDRSARLRRLLHLVLDLEYRIEEEGLPRDAVQEWLRWLVREGGPEPPLPEPLAPTAGRIRRLGRLLRRAG
jgi:hypothetical protein